MVTLSAGSAVGQSSDSESDSEPDLVPGVNELRAASLVFLRLHHTLYHEVSMPLLLAWLKNMGVRESRIAVVFDHPDEVEMRPRSRDELISALVSQSRTCGVAASCSLETEPLSLIGPVGP